MILLIITFSACYPLITFLHKLGDRDSYVDVSRIQVLPVIWPGCTALAQTAENVAKLCESCEKVCEDFQIRKVK